MQETFQLLWQMIPGIGLFLVHHITDGYKVDSGLIEDAAHLVSKTAMTLLEGENCRLRHYFARLHRQTLYYSKSTEMLTASVRLLIYYS